MRLGGKIGKFYVRGIIGHTLLCNCFFQQDENEKNNEVLRKSLHDQEIKLNRIHQEKLEQELRKFEQQHKEEVEVLDGKVESLNNDNEGLENEIAELSETVRYKMECLRRVLDSFRQFIETSPGFYEGQAEFVLKDLIPLASYTEY